MTDSKTLGELVDDLTNPIQVREPIIWWDHNRNRKVRWHCHTLPSLLDQLDSAAIPGEVYVEDNSGHVVRAPRSTPPARLEAINALMTIEAAAARWCIQARVGLRADVAGCLRALVGAHLTSTQTDDLSNDLRHWYGWAATLAGWRRPPWTPQDPCPLCGQRSLRIRLDTSTAACLSCNEAWTPDTIGLLAASLTTRATTQTDTRKLRRVAVMARRHEEQRRFDANTRPDLPYVVDSAAS